MDQNRPNWEAGMFFTKFPHPANFSTLTQGTFEPESFPVGSHQMSLQQSHHVGHISALHIACSELWQPIAPLAELKSPPPAESGPVQITPSGELRVVDAEGTILMEGSRAGWFGVSGSTSMVRLDVAGDAKFFGMGQKTFGRVELSGVRAKFWNTDVWGDFHDAQWGSHPTDPPYFSTPYLIIQRGSTYVGLLLHTTYPCYMVTPGRHEGEAFEEWNREVHEVILGIEGGEPQLWVLVGPSLSELTRKLQALVGRTPMPPLWALGYHQSRWGYLGEDLAEMDLEFKRNRIPCDGLWLDLDYMRGFRIFQTQDGFFPGGTHAFAERLAKNGRRLVPIIDPGVKFEPGDKVYDDGHAQQVFCRNAEGREYIGIVWPGETVFPDFTLSRVRDWWAGYAKGFREEGFGGAWVDMNDPSTGPIDPTGMLFHEGQHEHAAHRNEYALGMQLATREGFLRAAPDERPFILSRSGSTGTSQHAAIWSGDNVSNPFYLRISIPTALGMSISGLPFNGADVGGFGGDCTEELMMDWVKAHFLFPFFRNHSMKGCRRQEPFAYSGSALKVIRHYIRLRYKLLPYLSGLFAQQEAAGDPILRPLFYAFDDEGLWAIDDQFLVGPSLLQAPFLGSGEARRKVILPGAEPWFDLSRGDWVAPGEHRVRAKPHATPLFVRAGSIIPMLPGERTNSDKDLRFIEAHFFAPPDTSGETGLTYLSDDGLTFAYQRGEQSELALRATWSRETLELSHEATRDGYGPVSVTWVVHGAWPAVSVNGQGVKGKESKVRLAGKALSVRVFDAGSSVE